ncbi:MAG: IPTL-CTERM sorting domain-containing protein [Thermoanaerobaculia bacterium]|nr:IPTL-CTERM sorting domain-containing protein [Thermoanaerobaculia bacterium]
MYRPVSCLLGLLGLIVATPSHLHAQPAACLAAADLVNSADFAASPRADRSAELMALWYSDVLVAEGPLYNRIHADLDRAAQQLPELDLWSVYRGMAIPEDVLIVFVDQAAHDAAENGQNESINCLTELLDVFSINFFSAGTLAYFQFDGRYNTPIVRSLFELIPEISSTLPNSSFGYFDTGCFHSPDGFSRVYFLEEFVDLYPAAGTGNVERIEVDANGTLSYEEYDHRADAPWQTELEACLDHQLSGDLDPSILGIVGIPTLSQIGLALLVLSLLAAGVVRMRFV